jgi:hypothetical protein
LARDDADPKDGQLDKEGNSMSASIPTLHRLLTPARMSLAAATAAVIANAALLMGDAFSASRAVTVSADASACLEAMQGRLPGEDETLRMSQRTR